MDGNVAERKGSQLNIVGDRCSVGDPVILHWAPSHTFGLDPAPGRGAGIDPEVIEAERVNAHLRVRGAED